MNAATPLLCAAAMLLTPAVSSAASLSYVSAWRLVECGAGWISPFAEFGDWDVALASPASEIDAGSSASQRSEFRPDAFRVVSSIAGDLSRGTSFFRVTFTLDEAATCTLTGSLSLLGGSGFACVSLVDIPRRDQSMVNEIIFAPPGVGESRPLSFDLLLAAGSYEFEAMIYGGGEHRAATGGIDLAFTVIPEPCGSALSVTGLLLLMRRCQKTARRRENCRIPTEG